MQIDLENIRLISEDIVLHYRVVPYKVENSILQLLCNEEHNIDSLKRELDVILNKDVLLIPVAKQVLDRLISTHYLNSSGEETALQEIKGQEDFLKILITEANRLNSSDIHLEAFEKKARIRFRIDGMMIERFEISLMEYPALINKIKILANLDIAEKRLPQDGRILYAIIDHSSIDIRVSVLPTLYGEKVVLRLLNNDSTKIDLYSLGISKFDLDNYVKGIHRPNGIILISGPTGSGKTTTLYATLKELNKTTRNILTIEDPIEYTLEGINQVQLRERIGLNFSAALKTFLRQDPDIIMVGEIRDQETASMAIRAALTGHLVLSTIHTNSAWGTVDRLIDMGIPSFLVANTLNTTVAQRLIRLLCENCKEKTDDLSSILLPKDFKSAAALKHHYVARGCEVCYYTGYKGRRAVYEIIPLDAEITNEIKMGNMNIENILAEKGIKTLPENAFRIFISGETSFEEIYPLLLAI